MAPPPVPALPDTARISEYVIAAQTGPFNVGFQLYGDQTDYGQWIEVWLNGVQLTPTADWLLSSPSGSLATVARPITDAQVTLVAAGTGTLRILGAQRPRRLASYDEARAITARDENLDHNATRAIEREAWDGKSRILRVPPGEVLAYLPALAQRANMQAFFDNAGNLTAGTVAPPAVPISVAVAPLLNSATLAVFRNALNVRRVLDVTQFGAVGDGATNSQAAWQAAYDAALPGEQVWVPAAAGNYVLAGGTVQAAKQIQWILEPGAKLDLTNAQRAFAGVNTPVNFPVNGDYGNALLLSRNPTQHGIYVSCNFLNDGIAAINYESIALFVVAQQADPLGGLVHDVVGVSARGYANNEDTRVYGEHIIALSQAGLVNTGLIGGETDLLTSAASVEVNGYGTYQKIGHAYYMTGPKRGSRAVEVGLGSATWFQGIHINNGAIDPTGYGFLWDNRFAVTNSGTVLVAKEVSNRQTVGVEVQAAGSLWLTNSGGVSIIATRPGVAGTGTVLDISVQQQNSGAVLRNFIDITGEVITATAGAEDGRVSITGLVAGGGRTFAVFEGSRIGPGADNVVNAGSAGQRYKEIFCVNNVINTSDEREKYGIAPIAEVVLDAWEEVSPAFYQWQASVAAKGVDAARIHAGYVAQRVIEAFEKHKLDPWRYAVLCKDPLFTKEKRTRLERRRKMEMRPVEKTVREVVNGQAVQRVVKELIEVPAVRLVPVVDEAGKPVMDERRERNEEAFGPDGKPLPPVDGKLPHLVSKIQVQAMHEEPIFEDVQVEYEADVATGDYRLGLRSDQCAVLEGAMLRRRLARLEATVAALKPAASAAQP